MKITKLKTFLVTFIIGIFLLAVAFAGTLLPFPRFKAFDSNGVPLNGGKLYTYAAGTTTPKSAYTNRACTVAAANPIVLDANGEATIYLLGDYKLNLKTSAGVQVTGWPIDRVVGIGGDAAYPEDYGAVGDGIVNDTVALNAILAAEYHITAPSNKTYKTTAAVVTTKSGQIIDFNGSTIAATGAIDGLVIGQNDAFTQNVQVKNLVLSGGAKILRLNNVLTSKFENIELSGGTHGLYTEGQVEVCTFKNLNIHGYSSRGILVGQLNGGTIGTYNFPELQKCTFDEILLAGYSVGVEFTASSGQVSGGTVFRNIIVQGAETTSFLVESSFNLSIDHLSTEAQSLPAANTYSNVKLGPGCGYVAITNSILGGIANDTTTYKYSIEHIDGVLYLANVQAGNGGAAGTADIYIGGVGVTANAVSVTGGASTGIVFASGLQKSQSLLVNVSDSTGAPILTWGADIPWIAGSTSGVETNGFLAKGAVFMQDDLYLNVANKGIFLKNAAGTVQKKVRLNDAGDGFVFE